MQTIYSKLRLKLHNKKKPQIKPKLNNKIINITPNKLLNFIIYPKDQYNIKIIKNEFIRTLYCKFICRQKKRKVFTRLLFINYLCKNKLNYLIIARIKETKTRQPKRKKIRATNLINNECILLKKVEANYII